MSHLSSSNPQLLKSSEKDLLNPHARVSRPMTLRAAHALAAFLLEHANLRPARLALDHRHDARLGDERRSGDHFAAVFLDQQHAVVGELGPGLAGRAVDEHDRAWSHSDLLRTGLDDC